MTEPRVSFILPTDTFATIEPVLEKMRQQTVADQIEVILLAPSAAALTPALAYESHFAALRILETPGMEPLAIPRTVGVRAASAPFIFIGETHSYLRPDALEKLMATAASGPWMIVVPGFESANPIGVLSWASFLSSYGRWSACLPAGEIGEAPLYDSLYRRDVLLELGDRLEERLKHGDDLRRAIQAAGHRVYFDPAARIDHLNIATPAAWWHEHFLIGLTIGAGRARQWPWWRRILYMAGAGLIPFVLLARVWSGLRQTARARKLPAGTFLTIVLLYFIKAAGELVGYAGGGGKVKQDEAMTRYEVRRIDFVN